MPLVYAVYWSPLEFVRALLDAGANPSFHGGRHSANHGCAVQAAAGAGFEAARRCVRARQTAAGTQNGSNQRGLNDYTPLHYLAGIGDVSLIPLLLERGATDGADTDRQL